MAKQWDIMGKSFLITGGASGLGAMYAEAFLKEGAKKVAILDISDDVGKKITAKLNAQYPGKVIFVKCDVGVESEVESAFEKVVKEFKQIDVVINNAGIMTDAPHAVWKACEVNWCGLVSFTMRAQKHMRKDEGGAGGTIVNISSIAGIVTEFGGFPAYGGSKAAVVHFGRTLATSPFFEETGVRVMSICPGPTVTPLLDGITGRCYNEKMGRETEKIVAELVKVQPHQKPESAVAAMMQMFKEGQSGSVWLTVDDKPAKDITHIAVKAEEQFVAAWHE